MSESIFYCMECGNKTPTIEANDIDGKPYCNRCATPIFLYRLRIQQIKQRNLERTQGEWKDVITTDGELQVVTTTTQPHVLGNTLSREYPVAYLGDMETSEREDHANSAFVANAPDDIEYLLLRIAKLEQEVKTLGGFLWSSLP